MQISRHAPRWEAASQVEVEFGNALPLITLSTRVVYQEIAPYYQNQKQ